MRLLTALLLLPLLVAAAHAEQANDSSSPSTPGGTWSTAPAGSEQDLLKWALAHSDPDELRRAAQEARRGTDSGDPDFLERQARVQQLLQRLKEEPSEAELMQEAVGILSNSSATHQQLRNALEALRYLVEPIDNANNLQGMGGLAAVVALIQHPEPSLQSAACYVLGTAASNNHEFSQSLLGDHPEVLNLLLALVARSGGDGSSGSSIESSNRGSGSSVEAEAEAQAGAQAEAGLRALYALSRILTLHSGARTAFYRAAGVHMLLGAAKSSGCVRTKRKAISLLTDLIQLDAPAMSAAAAAAAAAAQQQGSGASQQGSAPAAAGLDYSVAVSAALQLLDVGDDLAESELDILEKAMLALLALLSADGSSGAAAAELIADAGGLATLQRLQDSLATAVAAAAAAAEEVDGEESYAAELLGMVQQLQHRVTAAGSSGTSSAMGRDAGEL